MLSECEIKEEPATEDGAASGSPQPNWRIAFSPSSCPVEACLNAAVEWVPFGRLQTRKRVQQHPFAEDEYERLWQLYMKDAI